MDTIPSLLLARARAAPAEDAFVFRFGSQWRRMPWQELLVRVQWLAGALRGAGLGPGGSAAVVADCGPDWVVCALAAMCVGARVLALDPREPVDLQLAQIRQARVSIVFGGDSDQSQRLWQGTRDDQTVRRVFSCGEARGLGGGVIGLGELLEIGREEDRRSPGAFATAVRAVKLDDAATVLPKGAAQDPVMQVALSHRAWANVVDALRELRLFSRHDVHYHWLPLWQPLAFLMLVAQLRVGFAGAIGGRANDFASTLMEVRPTFLLGTALEYTWLYGGIQEKASLSCESPGCELKGRVFQWAARLAAEISEAREAGRGVQAVLKPQAWLAERLVFAPIRRQLGGRIRFLLAAGSPLDLEVARFLDGMGTPVLESYGVPELGAISTISRRSRYQLGTVGLPLPGTELRISDDSGEILLRNPAGRANAGDGAATPSAIHPEEWLRTGDFGRMTKEGFLEVLEWKPRPCGQKLHSFTGGDR